MSGGVARVMVPNSLRKTIKDIKEIAGKHSDEDIYAMLKECNMDPNETAQKLLYLDTFHEVKSKRDKKKVNTSSRAFEEYRWTPGMQRRGFRGGRGDHYSSYASDDATGGRQVNTGEKNLRNSPMAKTENGQVSHIITSSMTSANGPITNGMAGHESGSRGPGVTIGDATRGPSAVDISMQKQEPTVYVKQVSSLNPGSAPAPISSTTFAAGVMFGIDSKSSSSHIPKNKSSSSVSGVYSSASDPVLMPSFNPRSSGVVGTIKREVGNHRVAPECIVTSVAETRPNAAEGVSDDVHGQSVTLNSGNKTGAMGSQTVEKSQMSPRQSSLTTLDSSPIVMTNEEHFSGQHEKVDGTLKGTARDRDTQSHARPDDSVLEQATSELEMKLNITRQPVKFPDHLQVPEALRNGLTFGSLEGTLGQSANCGKDSLLGDGTAPTTDEPATKSSASHQRASSAANESEYSEHPQSHPNVPQVFSSLEDNVTSNPANPALRYDQSKQEMMPPPGAQYPLMQTAADYGFGIVPPLLSPPMMQFEGHESQVGNSTIQSTSGSTNAGTQPMGVGQGSIAVAPQLFPLLRQPYPSNYIPYNPYYPHLYMSQSPHQFIGHNGFPQQPSASNVYMPSAATAGGVKFPIPPVYKPGTVAGNVAHFGIASGYGSYGSSTVGYSPGTIVNPVGSTSNEDLAAVELKEKSFYPGLNQNEESQAWSTAPGRDMSSLQANFYYNYQHGQHVAFPPSHSGPGSFLYHPTQTMAAPSTVQSLTQQSQATMSGSVDPLLQPNPAYQQPHAQINWNNKLLNRENI